ncbi:metal-binding protein [Candidatus Acetothermia bacterium]|nr:metal-binding protein [Candidatus Acetothermia bacterium]MBI3642851.1 metal-binding protein [Candidatus Acetothermia bacterium]
MPSGKTHARFELIALPILAGAYYYFLKPGWMEITLFATAYLLTSLFLSPDLDLHKNSARRRWGVLGFIWAPYSTFFKHRGISHSLIIGPLTRLIYLSIVVGLVLYGLKVAGVALPKAQVSWVNEDLLLALAAGIYLSNMMHVLLDRTVTLFKSSSHRRRRVSYSR